MKLTYSSIISSKIRSAVFIPTLFLLPLIISCGTINSDKTLGLIPIKKLVFINPSEQKTISREESNDLKSLKRSLDIVGLKVTETKVTNMGSIKLNDFDLIILPYASAKELKDEEIKVITDALKSGVNLFFDGISKLNEAIDIPMMQKNITVSEIRDLQFAKNILYWTTPGNVKPFDTASRKNQVLCIDDSTHLPIIISGALGKGKFMSMATLFDPNTDKGYSRFPFLIEALNHEFGIECHAERNIMEMYFDPGMRSAHPISIDSLVKQWRKHKIKRIYAAGWYYDTDYDYARLLKACHENGILVYCWLETPMISMKFWNDHPEWREKTAYLKDAQIDWRYLMNLADENCRKQVFRETDNFLMKYDWDGVDFAEMYFEPSPVGPELPQNFTPMNNIVREEFKKQEGFDPVALFDLKNSHYWKVNKADWRKFADYRKDLCYRLKTYFLDFLSNIKNKKKDFEVMLTVIDVSLTPELADNIAEDTQNTLSLYKKYDITLQIEDPSNCWGLTPERYDKLGKLYRQYVKEKNKLVFDCNVVNSHEKGYGGFPSEIPSGEEIRQIAYNMGLHDIRPAFYAEDAVYEWDFKNICTVLANKAMITAESKNQWKISTPYTIFIQTGNKDFTVKLDNHEWLAGDENNIIIPQGVHKIKLSSCKNDPNQFKINNISGELNWARFSDNKIEFSYSEDITSCYVIVNKQPEDIVIDNQTSKCPVFSDTANEFTIKLPQGSHVVKILSR
jgi:hypothetical protein